MLREEAFEYVSLAIQHNLALVVRADPGRGVWTALHKMITDTGRELIDIRMYAVEDISAFTLDADSTAILLLSEFQNKHKSNELLRQALQTKPKGVAIIGMCHERIDHIPLLNRIIPLEINQ